MELSIVDTCQLDFACAYLLLVSTFGSRRVERTEEGPGPSLGSCPVRSLGVVVGATGLRLGHSAARSPRGPRAAAYWSARSHSAVTRLSSYCIQKGQDNGTNSTTLTKQASGSASGSASGQPRGGLGVTVHVATVTHTIRTNKHSRNSQHRPRHKQPFIGTQHTTTTPPTPLTHSLTRRRAQPQRGPPRGVHGGVPSQTTG